TGRRFSGMASTPAPRPAAWCAVGGGSRRSRDDLHRRRACRERNHARLMTSVAPGSGAASRIAEAEAQSAGLRQEHGRVSLVFTQVMYVVGSAWVGTAAKLGPSHLVFC